MTHPRNASGPKLRARKAKRQQPDSIPDLFTRAFHKCRLRKPHLFPANHLSWTEEQLHTYLKIAWEKAGSRRQKYYWNPADGLAKNRSQSVVGEPVASGVKPAPRIASRAQGRKAPTRSRTKRTVASLPPVTQAQPATPPPLDGLEHMPSPLTPQSTCSSISVPLQTVVRSADSTLRAAGGLPQARCTGDALPPTRMSPLSTILVQPEDGGAASSEAYHPFPGAPPSYIPMQQPHAPGLGPSSSISGDPGMWRGISGSVSSDGIPVPEVDPSLLDMQRQMREQMSRYYHSLHPSLGYAHMSSAVEHWSWR